MVVAKQALEECQRDEPLNLEKSRRLFKELSKATDEYVAAVDAYIERSKSSSANKSTDL
jgi:ribosome recycling factor